MEKKTSPLFLNRYPEPPILCEVATCEEENKNYIKAVREGVYLWTGNAVTRYGMDVIELILGLHCTYCGC